LQAKSKFGSGGQYKVTMSRLALTSHGGIDAIRQAAKSAFAFAEISMTSQSKLPPAPVGIELLLELLNASDGLVARDASPPDAPAPAEPETMPVTAEAEHAEAVEATADVETPVEPTDDVENRFAAHIVRGMSKSKTG
jgi:hypothetical protein